MPIDTGRRRLIGWAAALLAMKAAPAAAWSQSPAASPTRLILLGTCPVSRGSRCRFCPRHSRRHQLGRDTFGDWQVRCAPEGDECFMYQLALDTQKNPVAEVSILKLPADADADAGVTIVTPLGTLLTNGVVLQIDGGEARQYPFAWCSQVGCFARFGLAKTSIDAMKRGNMGRVTLLSVGAPETPVVLDVSLSGFTSAFDSLEVPTAPAAAPAGAQN